MTSDMIAHTEIDEGNSTTSSKEDLSGYDASSEFISSDSERDSDSEADPDRQPPRPGRDRHRTRGKSRFTLREQLLAKRSKLDRNSFSWGGSCVCSNRCYTKHYSLIWENRNRICRYRDEFEYRVFEKVYPVLSQLQIPRARREVIMQTYIDSKDYEVSSKSSLGTRNRSGKRQFERLQQNDVSSFPPSKCFLSSLPLEVQLQILRYCLTSSIPFLDFCFGYRFPPSELSYTTLKGQDDITLGILCTNRNLREHGLRILWQQNTFLYTRSDNFTLLNTDRLMKIPQITLFIRCLVIRQDCVWRATDVPRSRVMLERHPVRRLGYRASSLLCVASVSISCLQRPGRIFMSGLSAWGRHSDGGAIFPPRHPGRRTIGSTPQRVIGDGNQR